jgi:transposase-like protein
MFTQSGGKMTERDERGFFTEEFRRWAVSVVESGEQDVVSFSYSHGIRGHSTIMKWCRRYGGKEYPVMAKKQKNGVEHIQDNRQLQLLRNQVKVLESELKEARLKQATLETLIDIAEQHYPIRLKKNTGGKRLSK